MPCTVLTLHGAVLGLNEVFTTTSLCLVPKLNEGRNILVAVTQGESTGDSELCLFQNLKNSNFSEILILMYSTRYSTSLKN